VICGIIATHSKLGHELIRTAEGIAGPQRGLDFVSNEGLTVEAFTEVMRERLRGCTGATGVIVMTDVPGGSCTLACRNLGEDARRAWVITGVNLPMVLAFLQYRDSMEPEKLAAAVAERGVKAIEVVD
jgi:mannose/fructose-specific phosphotransferase system component IIA